MADTAEPRHATRTVPVVLHHAIHTRVDGVDYGPGDTVEVPADHVDGLVERGFAHKEADHKKWLAEEGQADEDQALAEREAVEGAAEIEASKVRSAEEARARNNEPAPVRRGRPPRQEQ